MATPDHSTSQHGPPTNGTGCSSSFGFCSNGRRRARTPMAAQTTVNTTRARAVATNTAAAYARVSSKDQEREGFSIPAQRKLLQLYARDRHLKIAREFDDVETAKQAGRSGFAEMIAFLKTTPSCRSILVEKTDRLYRNFRDYVTLEDLDVAIHFVKENTVVSPESRSADKLMHDIRLAMAKNYVDNLSEEVRKGLREKADQGHWPSVAPVGYVNNLQTHRIEPDPLRAPLITKIFDLYATGEYSVKRLTIQAKELGLTHPRSGRPMMKAQMHRLLQNELYIGNFRWLGKLLKGSHEPLVTPERFAQVQAVLTRKPRARYPKQRHAFMGLLTCARCGCSMTAEKKKGRYVYYRCTGFKGACGNTYIREEALSELLGTIVAPIQITSEVADGIASALQTSDAESERARTEALRVLDQRRAKVMAKIDRGYDDFVSGKISDGFWTRKSPEWETEVSEIDRARARLLQPRPPATATAQTILELAQRAVFLYETQDPVEQRRLLETVLSNCTFDRGTLYPTYSKPFDLLVRGNETGDWRGRRDSKIGRAH